MVTRGDVNDSGIFRSELKSEQSLSDSNYIQERSALIDAYEYG